MDAAMAAAYGASSSSSSAPTATSFQTHHYPFHHLNLPQPSSSTLHHHHQYQPQLASLPHHPLAPPPPPPLAPAPPSYYDPSPFPAAAPFPSHGRLNELRTLFIAGLPGDAKAREVYNLFKEFPGFQSCQLRNSGQSTQAYGFAIFGDQQSALHAMHSLNGLVFDLETTTPLHIDFAKSNSRLKRSRADSEWYDNADKRVKGAPSKRGSQSGIGGTTNAGLDTTGTNATQSLSTSNNEAADDKKSSHAAPHVPMNNPPCPTLFVANLGHTCTEEELAQLFMRFPGFIKVKMQINHGLPVAFVDFQDTACSTQAISLQGTMLFSSDGEGIRLEYARNRMGLPKRERA